MTLDIQTVLICVRYGKIQHSFIEYIEHVLYFHISHEKGTPSVVSQTIKSHIY